MDNNITAAKHLKADFQTKQLNRSLVQYLQVYTQKNSSEWPDNQSFRNLRKELVGYVRRLVTRSDDVESAVETVGGRLTCAATGANYKAEKPPSWRRWGHEAVLFLRWEAQMHHSSSLQCM